MDNGDCRRAGELSEGGGEMCAEAIRTSRAAKAAFVLGLVSFGLSFLAAVPGLVVGMVGLVNIGRSEGRLKGRRLAIAGMACCCVSLVFLGGLWMWSLDAEPLAEDYTVEDLAYAGAEYDETWALIESLEAGSEDSYEVLREMGGRVGRLLEEPDGGEIADVLSGYAEAIERLWEQSEADRRIIRRLAEFEYINDLSEPALRPDKSYKRIAYLGNLYFLHALLEAGRGDDVGACETLGEINSLMRRLCVSSRGSITKLTCFAVLGRGLQAATFLLNDPETSDAALEVLARDYVALSDEAMSMRNCIIFEYLAAKMMWEDTVPSGVSSLAAKRNSYMRVLRNLCEEQLACQRKAGLEPLCVWPRYYPYRPRVSAEGLFTGGRLYMMYNPVGSMLLVFARPVAGRASEWIRATDDMFGILLAMRMGREYSMDARDGGEEYVIDAEEMMIYRPGEDGRPYRKLPINPEVLRVRQRGG